MDSQLFLLLVVALLGACVGSFLNVVTYRLPRGISIRKPSRSFCPHCEHQIAWYDNIPVASYLVLAGRCRHCRSPMSLRYPITELLTAMVFVLAFDGFFVARVREGLADVGADWSILAAHLTLLAGLLALSVIDLEEYWVDVRITWSIVFIGLIGYGIWLRAAESTWPLPGDATAGAAVGASVGLIIAGWLRAFRRASGQAASPMSAEPEKRNAPARRARDGNNVGGSIIVVVAGTTALLVLIMMVAIALAVPTARWAFTARVGLVSGACFVALLGGSVIRRATDAQIVEAIEQERPMARRQVSRELFALAGAIVLGAAGAAAVALSPAIGGAWARVLHWSPIGSWQPIFGTVTALVGMILGGAMGWGVRIVFTLWLGKEAFGFGDVHLMAAAGAVAGWSVVLLGFFAGCVLALLGVIALLAVKRSRAIPFGPWLSLGILIMIFVRDSLVRYLAPGLRGLGEVLTGPMPG